MLVSRVLFAGATGGPPAVGAVLAQEASSAGMKYLNSHGISKENVELANSLIKQHNTHVVGSGLFDIPKMKKLKIKDFRNLGVDVLKGVTGAVIAAPVTAATGNPLLGAAASAGSMHYLGSKMDKLKSGGNITLGNGFLPA